MGIMIEELGDLLEEEFACGGITVYCDCGNDAFVELDGEGWCETCKKAIVNPLIEAGFI